MTRPTPRYPPTIEEASNGSPIATPLIDVVIVTARGSWELLDDCLRSLRANPPRRGALSIHVVDNASRDGTVESVRKLHPEVEIEELAGNRGFAHACNRAIRRGAAPFVLLLNPDTVIHPNALERLHDTLARDPKTAVVGPRLLGTDGRADHNAKRSFPTARAALTHFAGLARDPTTGRAGGYERSDIDELGAGPVEAVSGSCMLVRRSAIADVGLLDEGYWMYGEDLDWCRRFGEHGWETRYEGSATILHVKHGVTGSHRTLRTNWAFHRSMGRFYRRFDAGNRPLVDAAVYTGVIIKFLLSASRSVVTRRFASAPAILAGVARRADHPSLRSAVMEPRRCSRIS